MVVGAENIQYPFARLDWGDGQKKSDVPTEIFSQGREKPLARCKKIP